MMDVRLVMFKVDGTRREFPLHKPRTVIGRTRECDLRIPLASVSRQQCEIRVDDDGFVILQDLGSSNGTYLNDNRIQKIILEPGDKIEVGPVVFTVMIDGQPAEVEPIPTRVNRSSAATVSEAPREMRIEDEDDEYERSDSLGATTTDADAEDPLSALEMMIDDDDDDED